MNRAALRLLVAAASLAGTAASAHADTRRIAIVVGNNSGARDDQPLRFAETDAAKFGRVMVELGGVAPDDLFLLQGKHLTEITDVFARAAQRIAALHRGPATRVVVMFYFSGHSDGEALELGHDRLTFSALRHWLGTAGADVRVAIVDSCKSGALLAAKGGAPGAAFQIRLSDDLASSGEALLTSSAADEVALESSEIGGSFFTHHFISGLRGAADASGDGFVTLDEAYHYAYAHTLATTGETVIGPQHPAYDYRMSGQGELVLTELSRPSAVLELPARYDRILVVDEARDQVVAEVGADARRALAVQAGRYVIRAWRGGHSYTARVAVAVGDHHVVADDDLAAATLVATTSKGDERALTYSLLAAAGVGTGTAGSRRGDDYRETSSLLMAGYRLGWSRGALAAWGGLELGGGLVVQSDIHPTAYSAAAAIGAVAGGSLQLTPRVSLAVEGTLPVELLRRNDKAAIVPLPAGWLGVVIGF